MRVGSLSPKNRVGFLTSSEETEAAETNARASTGWATAPRVVLGAAYVLFSFILIFFLRMGTFNPSSFTSSWML